MFSPSEDQSRTPRKWRTALRNAAELVVAFATLDSYPVQRAPHGSPAGADAPLFDLDDDRIVWQPAIPRSTSRTARTPPRRAGAPPRGATICLAAPSSRHATRDDADRTAIFPR